MLSVKAIKSLIFIPVILLLTAGCSKYVPRPIDITKGEYYEGEEYQKLSKKDREQYCASLASELENLKARTEQGQADLEKNREDIRQFTEELRNAEREYSRLTTHLDELNQQLQELEALPKEWVLQYGECLWTLAGYEEIYGDPLKWTRIWRGNFKMIEDPDWVLAGWTIKIPRDWPRRHLVQQDEWLAKIAGYWEIYDNYRSWPLLFEANKDRISDPDLIFPDQDLIVPRDEASSE